MAVIRVFGVGGAGGNMLDRMIAEGVSGVEFTTLNTDAIALLNTRAKGKILLAKTTLGGLSCGNDILKGEDAGRLERGRLAELAGGADVAFIVAGLGGGTGSGVAPVLAEEAKKKGALTVACVTMPFASEGNKINENAERGLSRLRLYCDAVIVLPNDRLLQGDSDVPMTDAFKESDRACAHLLSELVGMLGGEDSLTLADLRAILFGGRVCEVGVGAGRTPRECADNLLASPMVSNSGGLVEAALVYVSAGVKASLRRPEEAVEALAERFGGETMVVSGFRVDETLPEAELKVLLVLSYSEPPLA